MSPRDKKRYKEREAVVSYILYMIELTFDMLMLRSVADRICLLTKIPLHFFLLIVQEK